MSHTHDSLQPSAWICRFAPLVRPGPVLDLAAGSGRHGRLFLRRGHPVTFIDRDISHMSDLASVEAATILEQDLESEPTVAAHPLPPGPYAAVVVTNYLHRPLLPALVARVAADGLFLYETFARGNERFGRPSNPDFLLQPGELLDAVHGTLRVLAYEDLVIDEPRPAAIQRIVARHETSHG